MFCLSRSPMQVIPLGSLSSVLKLLRWHARNAFWNSPSTTTKRKGFGPQDSWGFLLHFQRGEAKKLKQQQKGFVLEGWYLVEWSWNPIITMILEIQYVIYLKYVHIFQILISYHDQTEVPITIYSPENKHGTWTWPDWPVSKGKSSSRPPFSGFMLVLGGVKSNYFRIHKLRGFGINMFLHISGKDLEVTTHNWSTVLSDERMNPGSLTVGPWKMVVGRLEDDPFLLGRVTFQWLCRVYVWSGGFVTGETNSQSAKIHAKHNLPCSSHGCTLWTLCWNYWGCQQEQTNKQITQNQHHSDVWQVLI